MLRFFLHVIPYFIIATSAEAVTCSYTISSKKITMQWTGYKAEEKLPVSGTFKDIKIKSPKYADTPYGAFGGTNFEIDPQKVFSSNKLRDYRIASLLFTGVPVITGVALESFGKEVVFVTSILGTSKKISLQLEDDGKQMIGKGAFKVSDFPLGPNFAELAKACKTLHSGVTWEDVSITVKFPYIKICK